MTKKILEFVDFSNSKKICISNLVSIHKYTV